MRVELFGCALGEAMCERFINACCFPSALCCFYFVCFLSLFLVSGVCALQCGKIEEIHSELRELNTFALILQ